MTHLVYPGALHTRFHHALGAMYLMSTAIETLCEKGVDITAEEREAADRRGSVLRRCGQHVGIDLAPGHRLARRGAGETASGTSAVYWSNWDAAAIAPAGGFAAARGLWAHTRVCPVSRGAGAWRSDPRAFGARVLSHDEREGEPSPALPPRTEES